MMPRANDSNYEYNMQSLRERKAGAGRLLAEWHNTDAKRPLDSKKGLVPAPAVLYPRGRFISSVEGLVGERESGLVQESGMSWVPVGRDGRPRAWGVERSAVDYLE